MYNLRYYQNEAVDATFDYLINKDGNPLNVMCTATGKSVVIAATCSRAIDMVQNAHILVVTHSRELVAQNAQKLMTIAPNLSVGIYSAGLNKKQTNKQVTFCGIQSVWNKAFKFPSISLLLVDEAHTIPKKEVGTWRKFIADLKIANPYIRVIGYTATDYRTTQGVLTEGEDKLFDDVCYEYGILKAIEDGYVCPPKNVRTETHYDVSGVHKRGDEYIEKELQAAVNTEFLNRACVKEIIEQGKDRKAWLVFCSGKDHAIAVRDIIREYGITCETVLGDTPKAQRDSYIEGLRNGSIRCLTNNNCLTTGTDVPRIDLIACMRPTGSAGLWVQMLGRGFRLYEGKDDFMVLDFTQNTPNHGAIDKIRPKSKEGSGNGEAPHKMCPDCMAVVPASARECQECGYEFPINDAPKITANAIGGALLSNQIDIRKLTVKSVHYYRHKKTDKPDSLKIAYMTNEQIPAIFEWVFPELQTCRRRFETWWNKRTTSNAPLDVTGCLELVSELKQPKSISVRRNGKWDEVVGYEF